MVGKLNLRVKVWYYKNLYLCKKSYPVRLYGWTSTRKYFGKSTLTVVGFPPLPSHKLKRFLSFFEKLNQCKVVKAEFYLDGAKLSEPEYNNLVEELIQKIAKVKPNYKKSLSEKVEVVTSVNSRTTSIS
ncbi:MAG: hypothetical protein ACTSPL_06975 [Candidatus Odinarchaeia archaeon]